MATWPQKPIPLQEGLKPAFGSVAMFFGVPQKPIPLQEGLKHTENIGDVFAKKASKANSTTRRIETKARIGSTRSGSPQKPIPLQEGLKRRIPYPNVVDSIASKANSTTRRIETQPAHRAASENPPLKSQFHYKKD